MSSITRIDQGQPITIHYETIGSGEPIVFHHGNGNCLRDWHTLGYVKALAADFQLILIDSRGYGDSSKPHDPKAYSLQSRADDTIAVLDALNIQQAHCFGGSVGASVCLMLARYHPQRCKSYIFGTPYFIQFDAAIRQALLAGPEAFLAHLETVLGKPFDNLPIRKTMLANDTKALWAANSSEWFDYRDYAQYVTAPSLIYVGSKEPFVPELMAFSQQLPQCEIQILPGVEHVQAYWDGALVAPLIRAFVAQHTGV